MISKLTINVILPCSAGTVKSESAGTARLRPRGAVRSGQSAGGRGFPGQTKTGRACAACPVHRTAKKSHSGPYVQGAPAARPKKSAARLTGIGLAYRKP